MIYGYNIEHSTMIVSATNCAELESFKKIIEEKINEDFKLKTFTLLDFMREPSLKGLGDKIVRMDFNNPVKQDSFIKEHGIRLIPPSQASDFYQEMLANQKILENPELAGKLANSHLYEHGNKTLAEIHGLTDSNDTWDRRTPEQKEQDRAAAAFSGRDNIMGESFDFDQNESESTDGIQITGIIQNGGNFAVSAIKKSTTTIKLSAEKREELEKLQSQVSDDIFKEKLAEAMLEQGLIQLGLTDDERSRVFDLANEHNQEYSVIIGQIERGEWSLKKFEQDVITKTVGFGGVDLAVRVAELPNKLRDAGFSDEMASVVIESVDISKFTSMEEYIMACEETVINAIADKQQKDTALAKHKAGEAYSIVRRNNVNPFDKVLGTKTQEDVSKNVSKDEKQPSSTEQDISAEAEAKTADLLKNIFGSSDEDDE
jgi:hypothetical protein